MMQSSWKKKFFDYLGNENDLNGYQRSYKLVLYKCLFKLIDKQGVASAHAVAECFRNYYLARVNNGKVSDTEVDSRIANVADSTIQDVYAVILMNPFKYISEKGFISKQKDSNGKEQFCIIRELMQELDEDDIKEIQRIVEKKLTLYFSKIDNLNENIRRFVSRSLNEYATAKTQTFAAHPLGTFFRNEVPRLIYDTGIVNEDKYLITGSVGQGNWATIPWVCIFNRSVTTTATKGVYIVYLLSKDTNTLYLTFNQGCTEISQRHSKKETIEMLRTNADAILKIVDYRGFQSDQAISLGDGLGQLAEFYQKGTILYTKYDKNQIPGEEELRNDLKNMLAVYDEYVSKTQNNEQPENTAWWPTKAEYAPGISKEQWLELLNNPDIFNANSLAMLAGMSALGGITTCKQLAEIYGNPVSHYIMITVHTAERVSKVTKCPVPKKEQNSKWWPILFVGKDTERAEQGSFIWKIRDELYEALKEFGIERFLPKAGEEKMTIKEQVAVIKEYIASKGFYYEGNLIENFYLSLKSKPFVILAGISGTGKTRLVKLFAEAIGAEIQLVPVRPDWSDSSDLFGYVDLSGNFKPGAIIDFLKEAKEHKDKPYFLCLDEMNLARVEHYLSDFLSVLETRERLEDGAIVSDPLVETAYYKNEEAAAKYGNTMIPDNLYVIGTVNMDETTFPFSKKVLDRANTIEFSFVDLMPRSNAADLCGTKQELDNSFLKTSFLYLNDCNDTELIEDVCFELEQINKILMKANLHVGYRVRDEIVFYMANNKQADLLDRDTAFDNEIMQKILPRIQGSSASVKDVLCELFLQCAGDYTGFSGSETFEQMESYMEAKECRYGNSARKIAFMVRRYEEDGFTSYWL